MLKGSTKVGSTAIQVEAETVKELIEQLSFFNELPKSCGNCNKGDLGFRHRHTSGYDFYELVCANPDCGHTFSLGTPKDDTTRLFPKHSEGWKPPYQKTSND